MDPRAKIRTYLEQLLRLKGDAAPFTDGDSLLASGRIDSLNVLEIFTFMESEFGYSASADGFDHDNFGSVDRIVRELDAPPR